MPIYGYDCNKCGHEFETLVRSSETPSCPSCVHRLDAPALANCRAG